MGFRGVIHNIMITGETLENIKTTLKKEADLQAEEVYRIHKRRNIYMVKLDNEKYIRLDIFSKNRMPNKKISYQKYINENYNINIPKFIKLIELDRYFFKLSEWIKGVRIGNVWNLDKMFVESGKELAKLNSIVEPDSNKYFILRDFSKINLIWTEMEQVFIIDLYLKPVELSLIDYNIARILLTVLKSEHKINKFLEGYYEIRDTKKILEILDEFNWSAKKLLNFLSTQEEKV